MSDNATLVLHVFSNTKITTVYWSLQRYFTEEIQNTIRTEQNTFAIITSSFFVFPLFQFDWLSHEFVT